MNKFKFLSFFSTVILCVGFTSCLQEDLEPETDLTSVVGEWENSGDQIQSGVTTTYIFKSNSTFEKNSSKSDFGSSLPVENITGTYTFNNETKNLKMTSLIYGESVYNVTKLTTKEMTLTNNADGSVTYQKK